MENAQQFLDGFKKAINHRVDTMTYLRDMYEVFCGMHLKVCGVKNFLFRINSPLLNSEGSSIMGSQMSNDEISEELSDDQGEPVNYNEMD